MPTQVGATRVQQTGGLQTFGGARCISRSGGPVGIGQEQTVAKGGFSELRMELRLELTPPLLDEQLVAQLAEIADAIDGNPSEALRIEFNRLAETELPMRFFQGVYGSEEHANFVRRVLRKKLIKPTPDVSREELIEVVRRAMKPDRSGLQEAYMAVLDINVPRPHASNLIFYPPDYDDASGTWGDGKPMSDYDPSPEQIVEWALDPTAFRR